MNFSSVAACAIPLIFLTSTAGASTPEAAPQMPQWERLLSAQAPDDALLRYGNSEPPSGTLAARAWARVRDRVAHAKMAIRASKEDLSEEGRARYRRAIEHLANGNPVVCRARFQGAWSAGFLDAAAGICVLNMLHDEADPEACRASRSAGIECRPHLSVNSSKIYVLRYADAIHMVDLESEAAAMKYPTEGLVGLEDGVFRSGGSICLHGDSRRAPLGALAIEGEAIRCDTTVAVADEEDAVGFGYGNHQLFTEQELTALIAYVEAQRAPLAALKVAPETLETQTAVEAAITTLDTSVGAFEMELAKRVGAIHPMIRSRAEGLVEAKLGRTLEGLVEHRSALDGKAKLLVVRAEVEAFIKAHVAPILPELARATSVQIRPLDLALARKERANLQALEARRHALVSEVEAKLPVRARRLALERIKETAGVYDKALSDRLRVVGLATTNLEARQRIDRVATDATVFMANITGQPFNAEKALTHYEGLLAQRAVVQRALAVEEKDPILAAHAKKSFTAILGRLDTALVTLEPSLPARVRIDVYDRALRDQWTSATATGDSWEIASLVQLGRMELSRLFGAKDEVAIQVVAVRRWTELRQDVLTHLIGSVSRTAPMDDDSFARALHELPAPGVKPATPEVARLAKLLGANGFKWKRRTDAPTTLVPQSVSSGPIIVVDRSWRVRQIGETLDRSVVAWTRCVDAMAADWEGTHGYLKTCRRVYRAHGAMPHIKELASEIHESLAMIHQTMTRESCVALRWKHPRAFYVDTIKGQCEILAAEEKKVRSAARAKSLIQAALEKRNFPYARLLLEKLRMTRAPGWVLSDVASAIDAAERFERDTKAAVEAESRVKLLMAELPHVERLCRADLQARTYEHIQFERAIRIGATQKADDFQAKRDRSEERGCRARARAHEAYAIYEAQGRPVAAQSVLEVAPTCFRSFTCVD